MWFFYITCNFVDFFEHSILKISYKIFDNFSNFTCLKFRHTLNLALTQHLIDIGSTWTWLSVVLTLFAYWNMPAVSIKDKGLGDDSRHRRQTPLAQISVSILRFLHSISKTTKKTQHHAEHLIFSIIFTSPCFIAKFGSTLWGKFLWKRGFDLNI